MPRYLFRCPICLDTPAEFELRMSELDTQVPVHDCGQAMKRVYSAPALFLNGRDITEG